MSPRATATFHGFGQGAVEFFTQLEQHNERPWWKEHRPIYETEIAEPMRALATDLAPRFGEIRIFRPYRDVRFSHDKRPIREHAAMATDPDAGGMHYLEFSADGLRVAGGFWQPGRDQLERFRRLLDTTSSATEVHALLDALASKGFIITDEGALTGAPRGFRRDHSEIALLRRVHLAVGRHFPTAAWMQTPKCRIRVEEAWTSIESWNVWLADRVGPSLT